MLLAMLAIFAMPALTCLFHVHTAPRLPATMRRLVTAPVAVTYSPTMPTAYNYWTQDAPTMHVGTLASGESVTWVRY